MGNSRVVDRQFYAELSRVGGCHCAGECEIGGSGYILICVMIEMTFWTIFYVTLNIFLLRYSMLLCVLGIEIDHVCVNTSLLVIGQRYVKVLLLLSSEVLANGFYRLMINDYACLVVT